MRKIWEYEAKTDNLISISFIPRTICCKSSSGVAKISDSGQKTKKKKKTLTEKPNIKWIISNTSNIFFKCIPSSSGRQHADQAAVIKSKCTVRKWKTALAGISSSCPSFKAPRSDSYMCFRAHLRAPVYVTHVKMCSAISTAICRKMKETQHSVNNGACVSSGAHTSCKLTPWSVGAAAFSHQTQRDNRNGREVVWGWVLRKGKEKVGVIAGGVSVTHTWGCVWECVFVIF